tara:strand:+ start:13457 stop:13609 length:153 start_codon:yes stop_codon:yes gene_type:complete
MKKSIFLLALLLTVSKAYTQKFEIKSPDGHIQIFVNNLDKISWSAIELNK